MSTCPTPAPPPSTGRPWLVWIDFDQTLTANDTIAMLGSSTRDPRWPQIVEAYLADYGAAAGLGSDRGGAPTWPADPFHLDAQLPVSVPPPRAAFNLDHGGRSNSRTREAMRVVQEEIQATAVAELRSLARINLVGIFDRVSQEALELWGREKVGLQPGALDTVKRWTTNNRVQVQVCSVNWSKAFVHGALRGTVGLQDIVSSDVVDGKVDAKVVTGVDKVHLLAAAVAAGSPRRSVFIGDSLHDLLAMLWANVGVLVVPPATGVPKASLRKVLDRAGVRVVPLSQFASEEMHRDEAPVVYTSSDWEEIGQVLDERVLLM